MSQLFEINWRRFGKEMRCIVRGTSMTAAVQFAREHYGTYGPQREDFQVGPVSERRAARLKCDHLNADQLTFT